MTRIACLVLLLIGFTASAQSRQQSFQLRLKDHWRMQSALTDSSGPEAITQAAFDASRWYETSVPTTIIGALLSNKAYDFDPFLDKNLAKLADARLDRPWWFRHMFTLPPSEKGKRVILSLHGINYTASVWLNGVKIADSTQIKGPFRIIQLDITRYIKTENILALQITRPFNPNRDGGDLAIDYADWIPYPPDYNAGILNDIDVLTFDKVGVQHPLVTTHFDGPALDVAHLTVDAQVTNYDSTQQNVVVRGLIDEHIFFKKEVRLAPLETADVTFTPGDFPQLNLKNPRIWWPWQYGKPELNRIALAVTVGGKVSNSLSENFGIREITSRLINDQSREFIINGRPIMLRGAAWAPDIFQRRSERREEQQIRLVRDMNMNIIRSEGKLEDDSFYDLCDRYGILVMTGWMCCGAWQHPEHWDAGERVVAMSSDSSVMYWLRNKASLMVWLNGSDMPPTDTSLERGYLDIERQLKWPNPVIATADGRASKVSGHSGVKMLGPYEWVPPIYWETDARMHFGGAWSFATEISPGPSIPPYESLVKFISRDSLSTTSGDWLYHCGTGFFATTDIFSRALDARYGQSASIEDFTIKAQAQNYEAERAMMEAYGLHKYNTATGVVQWMLNNPWPSLIWHTFDYYLYPGGAYFGMKKAMEPLHVLYSYKTKEVALINSYLEAFKDLRLDASLYDLDGTRAYDTTLRTDIAADSARACLTLPPGAGLSNTYFLRLQLTDSRGAVRSINWYWLSQRMDELDWHKSNWYTTPESVYADYTGLQQLPKTALKVSTEPSVLGDSTIHRVRVTNTGKSVAFFVHVRVLKGEGGDDILPAIFSDNYILLAPGEERTIRCSYDTRDAEGAKPHVSVSAWNSTIKPYLPPAVLK
jgi:exo-1,4-beta-D-glucosaminidase